MCLFCLVNALSLCSLLTLLLPLICCAFSEDHGPLDGDFSADVISHAFVQTGSELHYFRDISHQDSVALLSPSPNTKFGEAAESAQPHKAQQGSVRLFEADVTDFGRSGLGVPVQRRVFVSNPTEANIVFHAVSSSSFSFHCSFVERKLLSPGQRTFVRVFFFPLHEHSGPQESTIFLHTSIGQFVHRVRGETDGNPYRIRSFLGIRLPLNATFSAPLHIHNPHSSPMRISEIFTSDCNVHLEMAEMDAENMRLRPFETRQVGTAKVLGNVERNSTSFILVKTWREEGRGTTRGKSGEKTTIDELLAAGTSEHQEVLVVAVGVQVTRRRGLFPSVDLLDFGLIRVGDQSQSLILSVYSSLERGVDIESVYASKGARGVRLQFESRPPIAIKSAAKAQPGLAVPIASVRMDSSFLEGKAIEADEQEGGEDQQQEGAKTEKEMRRDEEMRVMVRRGVVVAESRGGNFNVSVPFRATFYKGEVQHDSQATAFHHRLSPVVQREVSLTNRMPFGLAIWGAELAENGNQTFEVSLITSPAVHLAPGQSLPVLVLRYLRRQTANFSTQLTVHTNLTSFHFPVLMFHGEIAIRLYAFRKDQFQFGDVGWGERRSILFTLSNSNPVPLTVRQFGATLAELLSLHCVGVQRFAFDNQTEPAPRMSDWQLDREQRWKMGSDFVLAARSFALFNLSLQAPLQPPAHPNPSQESQFLRIQTQFSVRELRLSYALVNATLAAVPSKLVFQDAFMGTVSTRPVKLFSSFEGELRVLRVSVPDGDPRFQLSPLPGNATTAKVILPPNTLSAVANLAFIPDANCPQDCYLGIPLSTSDGQWFAYGMKLPQNLAEIDHYLFIRLRRKWLLMGDRRVVRTSLRVDTDRAKEVEVPLEAHLVWPRLFSHPVVHFPLTAVGNFTIVNLTLSNPSNSAVIVQLLPLVIYPDADLLMELFRPEIELPMIDPVEMNETLMFSLRDTELFTLRPGSPVPQLREEVEKVVGQAIPRFTQSLLLRPGMSTRVRIGFLPSDYSLRSSLLIIRNNLTGLEPVVLYGRGARMHMDIDNKTARSLPLTFEIQSQHLADCANPRRQLHKLPTTLTVRRSFAVRNSGEVSFSVVNISVNNFACENRGFRVLNCDRFRLEPNETVNLDIAYTPDFMLSVNEATLQLYMHMNGTPWAFDLVATIPPHLLSVCHAALPRPPFEAMMYYTCVFALTFCLICVVSCAYLEGDRVITCVFRQQFGGAAQCQESATESEEREAAATRPPPNSSTLPSIQTASLFVEEPNQIEAMRIKKKKEFLAAAPDAGPLNRLFWRSLNFVLWLFSHIWPLNRGNSLTEQPLPQKKSRPRPRNKRRSSSPEESGDAEDRDERSGPLMADEEQVLKEETTIVEEEEAKDRHPKDPEPGGQAAPNLPPPVLDEKLKLALGEGSLDLDLYWKFRSFLSVHSSEGALAGCENTKAANGWRNKESSISGSEEQKSTVNGTSELGKSCGMKKRRKEAKAERKKLEQNEGKPEMRKKELSESDELVPSENEEEKKETKKLARTKQEWGFDNSQSSQSTSGSRISSTRISSDSDSVTGNRRQNSSAKGNNVNISTNGNRTKRQPEWFQKLLQTKGNESREKRNEPKQRPLWGSKPLSWNNGESDGELAEEEEETAMSDTSTAPEWADQSVPGINAESVDEVFESMVAQSADLFVEKAPKSCSSMSSSSTGKANRPNKSKQGTTAKVKEQESGQRRRKDAKESEEERIKRLIEQLTSEYREKLTEVLTAARSPKEEEAELSKMMAARKEGLSSSKSPPPYPQQPVLKLTLPADLSANCEATFAKRMKPKANSTLLPSPVSEQQRRRKSPGGEFSARLRKNVAKQEAENSSTAERAAQPWPPAPAAQFESLFNIGDPVWKPIGEIEEQLHWPMDFSNTTNNKNEDGIERKKKDE